MTSIQTRSALLQKDIYATQYYVKRYEDCLKRAKMTSEGVEKHSYLDNQLVVMWNDFWLSLPDSPEIRTETFFALCDIAEEIFDVQ